MVERVEMRVLELFAGIGGFSVGLERAGGFKPVAFCEIDKHARKVLQKNWPGVTIYEDVKEITHERLKADGNVPDVITGGFPCQDISTAGKGAGLAGARSGLWFEFARIIKEVRPRWVIAENVSALRSRGLETVLGTLAEIGYDAEWHCIPASAVGAPHRRDRIWIIAYPNSDSQSTSTFNDEAPIFSEIGNVACPNQQHGGSESLKQLSSEQETWDESCWSSKTLVNTNSAQCEGRSLSGRILAEDTYLGSGSWWEVEPPVGRVADGFPGRTHRLKQLGNAVVPQIPEIIGKAILEKINAEQ